MGLGSNISKLRRKKNLTQEHLAQISGISKSYLSRIEEGRIVHPHPKTITRIASVLETTIEELLKCCDL